LGIAESARDAPGEKEERAGPAPATFDIHTL